MKKILLLILVATTTFISCEKEPLQLDTIVNLLADEEPTAVVDSMNSYIFENPLIDDVTPSTDVKILDYPLFLDYDPFTMIVARGNEKIDSCVKTFEVSKSEKELLRKAHIAKLECQKTNKEIIARIHREIESWSKSQKAFHYNNWQIEKGKLADSLRMRLLTESQYKEKMSFLEKSWINKMIHLNGQVKEKIKLHIERKDVCGKIKDCEKIYLNKVLEILGRKRYKKWIECHKYNYKKK